jgi:phosphohistidine phosphatase SixA
MAAKTTMELIVKLKDTASIGLRALSRSLRRFTVVTLRGAIAATNAFALSIRGLIRQVFSLRTALIGLGVGLLVKSFIDLAASTERLKARLAILFGSVKEGNKLFAELVTLAGKVPAQLTELQQSATSLAGVMKGGTEEVMRFLPIIVDLAEVSGLSIEETTGQIIRMYSAGAASADLFRERGINAMLGFQAGVSFSAAQTRKQLIAAWEDPLSKFRGAAQRASGTWDGLISMLLDGWQRFQIAVTDAGIFDFMKAALQELLSYVNSLFATGKVDDWAKTISGALISALEWVIIAVGDILDGIVALEPAFLRAKAAALDLIATLRELGGIGEKLDFWKDVGGRLSRGAKSVAKDYRDLATDLKHWAIGQKAEIKLSEEHYAKLREDLAALRKLQERGGAERADAELAREQADAAEKQAGFAEKAAAAVERIRERFKAIREEREVATGLGAVAPELAARFAAEEEALKKSLEKRAESNMAYLQKVKENQQILAAVEIAALQNRMSLLGENEVEERFNLNEQILEIMRQAGTAQLRIEGKIADERLNILKGEALREALLARLSPVDRLKSELKRMKALHDKQLTEAKIRYEQEGADYEAYWIKRHQILIERLAAEKAILQQQVEEEQDPKKREAYLTQIYILELAHHEKLMELQAEREGRQVKEMEQRLEDAELIDDKILSSASFSAQKAGQAFADMYELSGKKAKEFFYAQKAVSVAQTLIDTFAAAQRAYATAPNPVMGAIAAALATTAGLARVALITAQTVAQGGMIYGNSPSTTSDNIPVMATAGEFMHPVKTVQHYGTQAMEAIRQRAIPRELLSGYRAPRMAAAGGLMLQAGGPVSATQARQGFAPPGEDEGGTVIVNSNDPNLVGRYLQSSPGRKQLLNIIGEESFAVKRKLS